MKKKSSNRQRCFKTARVMDSLSNGADKAVKHERQNSGLINQMWGMDYGKGTQRQRFESKQKISLPVESKAEDTLKTLSLNKDTSGHMRLSDSLKSCAESPLDGSDSEESVVSGPSSPSAALHSPRCRKCEGLFAKMKRRGLPRKKQRDSDPASLSYDEWLLKKPWRPQRLQQSRGRLWVHLKRIRLQAGKQSGDSAADKAWTLCSRPHVFLHRNLRHCQKMSGKSSKRKAKPVRQRRNRAKSARPPHSGKYQRQKKRKSPEKDDASEDLSPLDLSITSNDNTQHEGLQRSEKVPKNQTVSDASGFMDMQAKGSGLVGTRRVLKFDTPPSAVLAETQNPKHRLGHGSAGAKLHEGQAKTGDSSRNLDDVPCEDVDVFRTLVDPFSTDLKIAKKSRPSRPFGPQKDSFRTMLAALGHSHNQIIKESQH